MITINNRKIGAGHPPFVIAEMSGNHNQSLECALEISRPLLFVLGLASLAVSLVYAVLKFIYWDMFQAGTAPVLIGVFFLASVQLFFIGILGEYVAAIHTQILKRPLVIKKLRINFDKSLDSDK